MPFASASAGKVSSLCKLWTFPAVPYILLVKEVVALESFTALPQLCVEFFAFLP